MKNTKNNIIKKKKKKNPNTKDKIKILKRGLNIPFTLQKIKTKRFQWHLSKEYLSKNRKNNPQEHLQQITITKNNIEITYTSLSHFPPDTL